jgi:predicted restriction endonuclease
MAAPRRYWNLDELTVAFALYCQLPFGKLHKTTPEIVQLARMLNRTPSSVAMKCVNFASLDPAITRNGRVGLKGISRQDREIWELFHSDWQGLADRSTDLLKKFREEMHPTALSEVVEAGGASSLNLDRFQLDDYEGKDRFTFTKLRQRQQFFRRAVLSSYQGRCCITNVSDARLLIASHIVPWNIDPKNRLNPRNGLCLSVWHDRAFDLGLFTLTDDLEIVLSKAIQKSKTPFIQQTLTTQKGKRINLPDRFHPESVFLTHHRKEIFIDSAK